MVCLTSTCGCSAIHIAKLQSLAPEMFDERSTTQDVLELFFTAESVAAVASHAANAVASGSREEYLDAGWLDDDVDSNISSPSYHEDDDD
jgi:hypothetical protein